MTTYNFQCLSTFCCPPVTVILILHVFCIPAALIPLHVCILYHAMSFEVFSFTQSIGSKKRRCRGMFGSAPQPTPNYSHIQGQSHLHSLHPGSHPHPNSILDPRPCPTIEKSLAPALIRRLRILVMPQNLLGKPHTIDI